MNILKRMRQSKYGAIVYHDHSTFGKPEGKRQLTRRKRRWEDNIRMDVRKIGWEVVDWIHVAQDREKWRATVNTIMKLRLEIS
jgi:hypothetical protein